MTISLRQRNFINPFYEEYNYDWNSERNQWVLEGIHDTYLTFFSFPRAGKILLRGGPVGEGDSITRSDLQAYVSVYPQNARYVNENLEILSEQESTAKMLEIGARIKGIDPDGIGITPNLTSATTLQSQQPSVHIPVPGVVDLSAEQLASRLISLGEKPSRSKLKFLRTIFGNPILESITVTKNTQAAAEEGYFGGNQLSSANLYDWKKNVDPGSPTETTYYNPEDQEYYYVRRTNSRSSAAYDIGSDNNEALENKTKALEKGVSYILKFLGKNSSDSRDILLQNPTKIRFLSYLDQRPASRWIYAVSVKKSDIEDLFSGAVGTSTQDMGSTLDTMKTLKNTDKISPVKKVMFSAPTFDATIKDVLKTLRYYQSSMNTEMITPDMVGGFNIQQAVAQVETFLKSTEEFLSYNKIEFNRERGSFDKIEFCFNDKMETQFIVCNGELFTSPLGFTPFIGSAAAGAMATGTSSNINIPNAFSSCTPRTFKFIFDAPTLAAEARKNPDKRMPWSEFIKKYVYPSVKVSPKEEQEKIRRDKGLLGLNIQRNNNIFEALNQRNPYDNISVADLNREFFNKRNLMQNISTQLQKATSGCDSTASKLTKTVTDLMPLLKKKEYVALTREVVLKIRDELIQDQQTKQAITDIDALANPAAMAAIANKWLDDEISCLLDQLGKLTEDVLLPPDSDPGDGKKLIQTLGNNFPLKFRFDAKKGISSPILSPQSPELWKAFRKSMTILVKKFIKQLILAVLQDILKAALGCGPDMDKPLDRRPSLYGLSNLNTQLYKFLSEPSPTATLKERSHYARSVASGKPYDRVLLDVSSIAEDAGFANRVITIDENGSVEMKPQSITHEQIIALNYDVSRMTTPQELKNLLNGEASDILVGALIEMINRGSIDGNGLTPQQLENPTILMSRQESFEPGDTRYAMLGIDKDNLVEYFYQVGLALTPEQLEELTSTPELTPIEAHCETDPIPRTDISTNQIMADLDFSIQAKTKQIEDMCEMMNVGNPYQGILDDMWESLIIPEWYKNFLGAIAEFVEWIMELLGSYISDYFPETEARPKAKPHFENTTTGKEILIRAPSLSTSYYAPQAAMNDYPGSAGSDQLFFRSPNNLVDFPEDNVNFDNLLSFDRDRAWTTAESNYVIAGSNPGLAIWCRIDDNQTTASFYAVPQTPIAGASSIVEEFLVASVALSDANANLPAWRNLTLKNLRDPLGPGRLRAALPDTTAAINEWFQLGEVEPEPRFVSNPSASGYHMAEFFFYSQKGQERLKKFGPAISSPFLKEKDCYEAQEFLIATSICHVVWSRLRKFLMNVGPLFSSYPNIKIPDVTNALTDYLYRKFKIELERRQIWGICLHNIGMVGRQYETLDGVDMQEILSTHTTAQDQFKELIKQSYLGALQAMINKKSWTVGQNPLEFANPSQYLQYSDILHDFFDAHGLITELDKSSDEWKTRSQLITPVPLLIALEYIAYDRVADIIRRVPNLEFRYNKEIAATDDRLLTATRGFEFATIEQSLYGSFPITIGSKQYWSIEEVRLDMETYRDLLELSDMNAQYQADTGPLFDAAMFAISNNQGTGAENIADEYLGGINRAADMILTSRNLFATDLVLDTLNSAYSDGLTTTQPTSAARYEEGLNSPNGRPSNYVNSAIGRMIKAGARISTFSTSRTTPGGGYPANPVTFQLWVSMSAERGDVGIYDDEPGNTNFWGYVNQINAQVQVAKRKLLEALPFFYEYNLQRKILIEKIYDQRYAFDPPAYPFNAMEFVIEYQQGNITDAPEGVGVYPDPEELGRFWRAIPGPWSEKQINRSVIEDALADMEDIINVEGLE